MNARSPLAIGRPLALLSLLAGHGALADVTVQEQMTLDVAFLKAHTTERSYYSGEKKRHEYQFACDGMMKLFCGKQKTLDIVRVDQGVTWNIEDKPRTYTESALLTPQQWQTAMQQQQAAYDKLKSCPAARRAGPDTSKCQLSEPQLTVTKTDEHVTLLGHDTQRTSLTLTQSCKVRETGEECQMAYAFDVWLTQETIGGVADRQAFEQAYLKKQGLDGGALANPTLARAMAPYAESFRKLSARSGDLKGIPLRTRFRFAYGGAHCSLGGPPSAAADSPSVASTAAGSARDSAESSTATAAGWSAAEGADRAAGSGPAGYVASSTAGAFARSLVGGLFAKKRAGDTAAPAPGAPTDSTIKTPKGETLQSVAEMTLETVSIDASPLAASQFEVPAGYRKLIPETQKAPESPSCPST